MLDERLSLAASLYPVCEVGADIGTDHALLPCHLLKNNICKRMILVDISEDSIRHAHINIDKEQLNDRASIHLADGLDILDEPCGCISIMGMGGRTMRDILLSGKHKLQGAVLVLSAHTDLPLMRETICELGYHITREELCLAGGRYYIFWRAEPGAAVISPAECRRGTGFLWQSGSPLLKPYAAWRADLMAEKLRGYEKAAAPDSKTIQDTRDDLAFYRKEAEA